MDSAVSQSKLSTPLAHTLGFPVMREKFCATGIFSLLKISFPSAIIGFIISVIVLSSHREIHAGTPPHIGYEIRESVFSKPSVANLDAAPPIPGVAFISLIEASRFYGLPASKLQLKSSAFAGHAVGFVGSPDALLVVASTRDGVATCKVGGLNHSLLSALASTIPECLGPIFVDFSMRESGNKQASVNLSEMINFCRHNAHETIDTASAVNT